MMSYLKTDVLLPMDVFERLKDKCLEYYEMDPCYTYSTDVLLPVDVFERLKDKCLEYYEMDPCYTYSTPGLT